MPYSLPQLRIFFTLVLLCCVPLPSYGAFSLPKSLPDITFKPLSPLKGHKRTSALIFNELSNKHYRSQPMNDQLSDQVFNQLITQLDPQKYYFLQSDIEEFGHLRFKLDDAIKRGDLEPGFTIFNRYQQRAIERLIYAIDFIENQMGQLAFNSDELIQIDRDNAPWAKSRASIEKLWEKRLTNAALTLRLANKSNEDIVSDLKKRYRSQLQHLLQTKSEDAFEPYMNAFTQVYDPHTQYLSPKKSENFNINMSLSLEGIGAVLQREDEYTKVVRLVPAGPADKSKLLKPADRIVGVGQGKDGDIEDVIGWRIDEVVERIRGPKGTIVSLEIIPSTAKSTYDTQVIHIRRDLVKLEDQAAQSRVISIDRSEDKNPKTLKTGVIEIPAFYIDFAALQRGDDNYKSTTRDVMKLIDELRTENIDGLVIDLRNNGGGSLREANQLLGLFIHSGPTVQVKNNKGRVEVFRDQDASIFYSGPMAVLVNRLSASASEIFAAAIQDYQRGIIIGTQTFGKGTVQALRTLDAGQLKITQAKFYRISGESNQHQGVIPDLTFPSLYDKNKIGESALDNALPWDTISPVSHRTYFSIKPHLSTLKESYQKRTKSNPDFQYLLKTLASNRTWEEKKWLSLNESVRIKAREQRELKQLKLLNQKRTANNEPPLEKWPENQSMSASELIANDTQSDKTDKKPDLLLKETSEILADFIELQSPSVAIH